MSLANEQEIFVGLEVSSSKLKTAFLNEKREILDSAEFETSDQAALLEQSVELVQKMKRKIPN